MGYKNKSESGFSLIEVSIAMTVLALLLVPALKIYGNELERERREQERATLTNIKGALQKYALINKVYPFPADPTLSPSDAGFGKAIGTDLAALYGTNDIKVCNAANDATSEGVCVICDPTQPDPTAKKNCPNNARPIDSDFTDNRILIGAVPFTDLGLGMDQGKNYQGDKLMYAVTYKLTQPMTGATPEPGFSNTHGGIILSVQWHDDTTQLTGYQDEPNTHFVIFSPGEDRKNAFALESGTRSNSDCSNGYDDDENCDYDGRFISNVFYGYLDNASHYDDFITSTTTMTSDLWSIKPAEPHVIARNFEGKIAVGYTEPSDSTYVPKARIDVKGNIKASELATNKFCRDSSATITPTTQNPASYTGLNCFQPQYIGGSISAPLSEGNGIYCPATKALTGIKSSNQVCGSLGLQSSIVTALGNCLTAGEYPCGVSKNQKIMCAPPGWTAGQCVEQ